MNDDRYMQWESRALWCVCIAAAVTVAALAATGAL